jgi:hypothetical protein
MANVPMYGFNTPPSPFSANDFAFPGLGSSVPSVDMGSSSLAATGTMGSPSFGAPNVNYRAGFGGGAGSGFGFNVPTANLALAGLGTIGNLWGAFQSAKLAKKQFNYTKDVTETNLAGQIKSYNTALEDRIRSRAKVEGMSADQAQAYLDRNKLTRHN